MNDRVYSVSYNVLREKPPRTQDELEKRGRGGCDVFVGLVVHRKEDGSFGEVKLASMSGPERRELEDNELFVLWMAYARVLLRTCPNLSPGARKFIEAIRKATDAIVERKIV
jgi:hypothetical protein